jgi:hypothetical protein
MMSFEKAREYVLKVYLEWNYDRAVEMIHKLNYTGVIPLEDRTKLMEMLISLENGREWNKKRIKVASNK